MAGARAARGRVEIGRSAAELLCARPHFINVRFANGWVPSKTKLLTETVEKRFGKKSVTPNWPGGRALAPTLLPSLPLLAFATCRSFDLGVAVTYMK
jgi:hypothetical protein